MALVRPVIFQVVGYQNSGKTTFTAKLIETLVESGLKIVTIKHHGHGSRPDVVEQKDTEKHLSAGARASIIEGDGRLILQADNYESTLEDQITLLGFFHPDVILIEGYKLKTYPKLLIIKEKSDLTLLKKVNNIKAILYWKEELKDHIAVHLNVPCFFIEDSTAINWIVQLLQTQVHKVNEKS
ncbi:MAG: molybdopterin-guanine dinucleotide biosynthesis protein B [Bacillus sp. (in: Bacteria)]|nr:molybdopterin-guanine dinucleotide biosynthesis protein B [Bacillus sp. (in: firmicutes)]